MSTLHSFYLPPEAWRPPYCLDVSESHHLARVLRIKKGEMVRLFDGHGRQGLFVVESIGKKDVVLSLDSEELMPPPAVRCTLAAGFSKALRRGWFLEKAVELEASALWFWQGDFSQAALPDVEKDAWKGSLLAGAKQSENPWLPELAVLNGGIPALASKVSGFDKAFMLYEGDTEGRMLQLVDLATPGNILLIIGPEGGFSDREVAILTESGVVPVSLGRRVLRWETAAVFTLGLAWWARQEGVLACRQKEVQ